MSIPTKKESAVVIRFAGNSGDGMQLMGAQYAITSTTGQNDVNTFADYPAEIRAPLGTTAGISGFQIQFASQQVFTPGDNCDVLVALNPAALKVNLDNVKQKGIILCNSDSFAEKDYVRAGYAANPLDDGTLNDFQVIPIPVNKLTLEAVEKFKFSRTNALQCKNMLVLGVLYWLYDKSIDVTLTALQNKFKNKTDVRDANIAALKAGYHYAQTVELFQERYSVPPAKLEPGKYREVTGNKAIVYACLAAAEKSERPLLLSSYPITPASTVLHGLANHHSENIRTFQAEDEISAMGATIGAAYGGCLAMTVTSGPGFALIGEALGLAVMTELPMVIVNIQRAGPSTGLPTKSEQTDLMQSIYSRNGESPLPVIAAKSPTDCFDAIIEAFDMALKYMTPVVVLSDGSLAVGAQSWKIPDIKDLPDLKPKFVTQQENYQPYLRDPKTLARAWAIPGTPGLEHRIGGLEKENLTGNVSYDPDNHQTMVELRAKKIQTVAENYQKQELYGSKKGDLLFVCWGSSYGPTRIAVDNLNAQGYRVAMLCIKNVFPLPLNLCQFFENFANVLVVERNLGQLAKLLKTHYKTHFLSFNKVSGGAFKIEELEKAALQAICEETINE